MLTAPHMNSRGVCSSSECSVWERTLRIVLATRWQSRSGRSLILQRLTSLMGMVRSISGFPEAYGTQRAVGNSWKFNSLFCPTSRYSLGNPWWSTRCYKCRSGAASDLAGKNDIDIHVVVLVGWTIRCCNHFIVILRLRLISSMYVVCDSVLSKKTRYSSAWMCHGLLGFVLSSFASDSLTAFRHPWCR